MLTELENIIEIPMLVNIVNIQLTTPVLLTGCDSDRLARLNITVLQQKFNFPNLKYFKVDQRIGEEVLTDVFLDSISKSPKLYYFSLNIKLKKLPKFGYFQDLMNRLSQYKRITDLLLKISLSQWEDVFFEDVRIQRRNFPFLTFLELRLPYGIVFSPMEMFRKITKLTDGTLIVKRFEDKSPLN